MRQTEGGEQNPDRGISVRRLRSGLERKGGRMNARARISGIMYRCGLIIIYVGGVVTHEAGIAWGVAVCLAGFAWIEVWQALDGD